MTEWWEMNSLFNKWSSTNWIFIWRGGNVDPYLIYTQKSLPDFCKQKSETIKLLEYKRIY